jgi:O-acetylserine/cysteine efflux transporter
LKPRDVALAVLVAVVWGAAFVATRIGLDTFSPPQLTALRFVIAAVPAAFLPRPPIRLSALLAIGLTLFTGQFLLQFFAIAGGMPPGLASVIVQTQALFTVLLAAVVLRERPAPRQLGGIAIALVGVFLIAFTIGQSLTTIGLVLGVASALSWAVGNVLLKRVPPVDMLPLVIWLSLVPPLPSLALSMALDGPTAFARALRSAPWTGLAAAVYLGLVATAFAYALWGTLLRRYATAAVAPFALLAPVVGALASAAVFGERFGPRRLTGMALVLLGLVLIACRLPACIAPWSNSACSPPPRSSS